jgi:hypothetical protein
LPSARWCRAEGNDESGRPRSSSQTTDTGAGQERG